jgi:hypothetical protein
VSLLVIKKEVLPLKRKCLVDRAGKCLHTDEQLFLKSPNDWQTAWVSHRTMHEQRTHHLIDAFHTVGQYYVSGIDSAQTKKRRYRSDAAVDKLVYCSGIKGP